MNPQVFIEFEQPRPDSPTIPESINFETPNTHCNRRDLPVTDLHRNWMQAIYGERNDTPGATKLRIDYGPVTNTTALCSHAPSDEERAWMSDLSKEVRMMEAQERAREVENLLKKSASTKEKEMREIFWGAGSVEAQSKKPIRSKRAAGCLGAGFKILCCAC